MKYIAIIIASVFTLSSCKKEEEKPSENLIVGKWIPTKITTTANGILRTTSKAHDGEYLVFNKDNTLLSHLLNTNSNVFFDDRTTYEIRDTLLAHGNITFSNPLKIVKLTSGELILYQAINGIEFYEYRYYYLRDTLNVLSHGKR